MVVGSIKDVEVLDQLSDFCVIEMDFAPRSQLFSSLVYVSYFRVRVEMHVDASSVCIVSHVKMFKIKTLQRTTKFSRTSDIFTSHRYSCWRNKLAEITLQHFIQWIRNVSNWAYRTFTITEVSCTLSNGFAAVTHNRSVLMVCEYVFFQNFACDFSSC
jgi:hypothetical protein